MFLRECERHSMELKNNNNTDGYYDHLFKLIIIGESGVGKTCITVRFTEQNFRSEFTQTLGVDFKIKTLLVKGKKVKLQIWDTAGQERYNAITTSHYKQAHGVIIVYDITNYDSFNCIRKWLRNVEDFGKDGVHLMLVGNKLDLKDSRQVTFNGGIQLAKDLKMKFFEVSAKTNYNISEIFTHVTENILKKIHEHNHDPNGESLKKSINSFASTQRISCDNCF